MKKSDLKKIKLPKNPGVYFFLKNKEILYIGKATSLSDRVKSYFSKDLIETRGPMILDMVTQSTSIRHEKTDSVLEALILESNLIKKHQPKYNTKEKDNKSFNYVCITNEEIPKVLIVRGRTLEKVMITPLVYKNIFGPFPNGAQLKEAMKIIRRIFPYVDEQSSKKNNVEFYRQLGLAPEIKGASQKIPFQKVLGSPRHKSSSKMEARPDHFEKEFQDSLNNYKKNIKNLKLFFEGKKKCVITNLKKEMLSFAKKKEFEKANEIKKKIFALNHINDIALIKEESQNYLNNTNSNFRIEAYDVAHMSGENMVGVMVVVEDGELNKKEYRKFVVRTVDRPDDTKALAEILDRRLAHKEWHNPDLIVVDGGLAQINKAKQVLKNNKILIPVVSVLKDDKHKAKAIIGDDLLIKKHKKDILLANAESHRFAITFHKQKRSKAFII
ncbi:MAG: hypothetical protein EOM85_02115 [Candidatus Moranbacteria bacterium]|nr:hypothetical protein [Candidatus Moranbacteria bacterium]